MNDLEDRLPDLLHRTADLVPVEPEAPEAVAAAARRGTPRPTHRSLSLLVAAVIPVLVAIAVAALAWREDPERTRTVDRPTTGASTPETTTSAPGSGATTTTGATAPTTSAVSGATVARGTALIPGVSLAAIDGPPSGDPIPIDAIRTDATTHDLVIALTDLAPERHVVVYGSVENSVPPDPSTEVGVCTLGYTVSVTSGSVPTVSVQAVVDPSRHTIAQRGDDCVTTGTRQYLHAHSDTALTGTEVRDASSGGTVPLLQGILLPTVLPASITPTVEWAEAGGWGLGYDDGLTSPPGISILLLQGFAPASQRITGFAPVRTLQVGGHSAELLASGHLRALRWTNRGTSVVALLQPIAPSGPDDSLDDVLIEFAAGLR